MMPCKKLLEGSRQKTLQVRKTALTSQFLRNGVTHAIGRGMSQCYSDMGPIGSSHGVIHEDVRGFSHMS